MKKTSKILSLFLALTILIGVTAGFGISAFANESPNNEYEYSLYGNGNICIDKYKGNATELTIPNKIDGKPVTKISYMAFGFCKSLKSVTIPNSITEIDYNAFVGCSSLESINIPNGVKILPYSIFGGCKNLKKIVIPDSVTTIEQWAFEGCTNLTHIIIPANVELLGPEAFVGCSSLRDAVILNKECKIYNSFIDSNEEERFKLSDFTIYGYQNSTAQVYAEEQEYNFVAIDEPIISDGTDAVYKQGSENGASIHCVYPLDTFINVAADGNIVDKENYELTDGSTILTFKPSYLDTLSVGKHTITMEYTIGTVSTELTVEGTAVNNSEETTKLDVQTTQKSEKSITPVRSKSTKSPDTGYNCELTALIPAALTASIMLISIKRKKH